MVHLTVELRVDAMAEQSECEKAVSMADSTAVLLENKWADSMAAWMADLMGDE